MLSRINSIFITIVLALSLFVVIETFASKSVSSIFISIVGCFLLGIIILLFRYKTFESRLTASVLGCIILLPIVFGYELFRENLSVLWVLSGSSLLAFYMVVQRIKFDTQWIFPGIVLLGIGQAAYGLGQYFHWFANPSSNFAINGSFDNPAGFAATLVAVFPFSLYLIRRKKIYWRMMGAVGALLLMVAVGLSGSRAGVVGLAVVAGCWLFATVKIPGLAAIGTKLKVFAASLLLVGLVGGLYGMKKDSADGRLLIWQCSARMVADKPLLGHGTGGFEREYMLYQAEYFREHPDSRFAPLADIVKHPFNEFLLLVVEHGLAGLLLAAWLGYLLVREYRRRKTEEKRYAAYCLMGLGAFACFSYPFNYPFVRLMAVFAAALVMKDEPILYKLPQRVTRVLKPVVLIACLSGLGVTGKMFFDEYEWNTIARRSLNGETLKVLPDYARLYKTLNRNGLFLYNYAAELNYIGECTQSNVLMNECARLYNDNDVQLILADNYQQLKQYRKAEECLKLAYQMIPNRFIPLYRLALLYQEEGKPGKALQLARQILQKPVKINSPEIVSIQQEMRELIDKYGQPNSKYLAVKNKG